MGEVRYSHPDLLGREYAEQQRDLAMELARETQMMLSGRQIETTPERKRLLSDMIKDNHQELRDAIDKDDFRKVLRIALNELDIDERAKVFPKDGHEDARNFAKSDLRIAHGLCIAHHQGVPHIPPKEDNAYESSLIRAGYPLFEEVMEEKEGAAEFDVAMGLLSDFMFLASRGADVADVDEDGNFLPDTAFAFEDYRNAKKMLKAYQRLKDRDSAGIAAFIKLRMEDLIPKRTDELEAAAGVHSEVQSLIQHRRDLIRRPLMYPRDEAQQHVLSDGKRALDMVAHFDWISGQRRHVELEKKLALLTGQDRPDLQMPHPTYPGVARMFQIYDQNKQKQDFSMSSFEIALNVIMEEHMAQRVVPEPPAPDMTEMIALPPRFYKDTVEDIELEELLDQEAPKGTEWSGMVRWLARALNVYSKMKTVPDADPYIKNVVAYLRQNPSAGNVLRYAKALADHSLTRKIEDQPISVPAPQVDEATEEINRLTEMLHSLTKEERELAAAAMFEYECDSVIKLQNLIGMDPGLRELALRNHISAIWTQGDFRELDAVRAAKASLYWKLGLHEPTDDEKKRVISNPANLSRNQKEMVARLAGVDKDSLTEEHVKAFGIWLIGTPDEIEAYWHGHHLNESHVSELAQNVAIVASGGPDAEDAKSQILASDEQMRLLTLILEKDETMLTHIDMKNHEAVNQFLQQLMADRFFWLNDRSRYGKLNESADTWFASPEKRMNWWRGNKTDMLAVADFFHRMRLQMPDYGKNLDAVDPKSLKLTGDDKRLLETIYDNEFDNEQAFKVALNLVIALANKTTGNLYHDPVISIYKLASPSQQWGLFEAARENSEFNTLVEFLGGPRLDVRAVISDRKAMTTAKFRERKMYVDGNEVKAHTPAYETNEDSSTSLEMVLPGGEKVPLRAVLDGAGGHAGGHMASNAAKEAVEIAACAGWIKTKEDLRRALLLADLAVVMEQIVQKTTMPGGMNDNIRESEGNTTGTIAMQLRNELHVAHAGDSECKLLRAGKVIFTTNSHDWAYELRRTRHTNERFKEMSEQEFHDMVESVLKGKKNQVFSMLGVTIPVVDLDTIKLQNGDIWLLSSDGMTEVVSDEEIARVIWDCNGDLERSAGIIGHLAQIRRSEYHIRLVSTVPDEGEDEAYTDLMTGHMLSYKGADANGSSSVLLTGHDIHTAIDVASGEAKTITYDSYYGTVQLTIRNDQKLMVIMHIDHRSIVDKSREMPIKNDDQTFMFERVNSISG